MPRITSEDGYLTVLNLFRADEARKRDTLLGEMRKIVDTAAFPGWISSTVHSGQGRPGTANVIQWRSGEDLEARYSGEEFKHRTLPVFRQMTTSIKLLQTEVAYTQRCAALGEVTEITPERDDFTVIEVLGVAEQQRDELVDVLGEGHDWLLDVPGYRSHTVLRGLRARGFDGAFAVTYSQWDSKEAYDAYRAAGITEQAPDRQKAEARVDLLAASRDWNTYRVVHTRSAGQEPVTVLNS